MCRSGRVRHGGQLVTVRIQELLCGLLCAHTSPLAIGLGREVAEVAKMASRQSGQLRNISQEVFGRLLRNMATFQGQTKAAGGHLRKCSCGGSDHDSSVF